MDLRFDDHDRRAKLTRSLHRFIKDKWYDIRLRVLPDRLQAWIDGEKVVDVVTTGKKITTRVEVDALAQVAAGAQMLDVNAGIPLADEPGILAEAIRRV